MAAYGLPTPTNPAIPAQRPVSMNIGGVVPVANVASMMATQAAEYPQETAEPQVITGLAGHIKSAWGQAEFAKRPVEQEMLEALRARRGEYMPAKQAQILEQKQPAIYMMIASSKMRQIEALLRDVLIGSGTEKPWTLRPSADPELPPELVMELVQNLTMEIEQALMMGLSVTLEEARERARMMKEQLHTRVVDEARVRCERMEYKMEDQLVEGNYIDAIDQFITDIATYKTAWIAGPIIRNKPKLTWGDAGEPVVETKLSLEWERVDPFDMYPAAWARNLNDGPMIRRHKLTRQQLNEMIGVEGYSEPAIRKVLELYGMGGLHNWLAIDSQRAIAEGKTQIGAVSSTELIDALQFWGSASGEMLVQWGMDAAQIPDQTKEYQIEAWLIGSEVIRAVLNADPLGRRQYYACSFQRVPGSVWGNSPYDLLKDCQDMANAAARAMAANLGISSGPQVAVMVNRMPAGEDITDMYPWKIWQFESDPMGSTADPIKFFQPTSNAAELMQVYEKFAALADEYTGIPRYMSGLESGGLGRTASGLSMMVTNASKTIKQVVASIDSNLLTPMLERLYYYNMRYSDDPDLKGDVNVVARGAMSLVTKETAQQRTLEFLQATANPFDMQILGVDGRAELLRMAAQRMDTNTDKIVPPVAVMRERQAMIAAAAMQAQPAEGGSAKKPGGASQSGQQLDNGAPVTDVMSPSKQG